MDNHDPELEYPLPCHPSLACTDPLKVRDSAFFTPSWIIFESSVAMFRQYTLHIWHLPDLIQDLAYSLRGDKIDVRFMKQFLKKTYPDFDDPTGFTVLEEILRCASALPSLFPEDKLSYLSPQRPSIELTRNQLKSLVAHQLLCTVRPLPGSDRPSSLQCWYYNHQPKKKVVWGYLSTLFHYFLLPSPRNTTVLYEYLYVPPPAHPNEWLASNNRFFGNLVIEPLDSRDSIDLFPHSHVPCTLIPFNGATGFGPTGNLEELIYGACPELLPFGSMAFLSPVPPYSAFCVRRVLPKSAWEGRYGHPIPHRLLDMIDEHSFLFIDIFDSEGPLSAFPDIESPTFERILNKAYTGFLALLSRNIREINVPIWGMWGTGYGADPIVSTIILSMVASLTGVHIRLTVDEYMAYEHMDGDIGAMPESKNILRLLQDLQTRCAGMTIHNMWLQLMSEDIQHCRNGWDVAHRLLSSYI